MKKNINPYVFVVIGVVLMAGSFMLKSRIGDDWAVAMFIAGIISVVISQML